MNNRELLEKCARACGINGDYRERITAGGVARTEYGTPLWNPLTNSADCAEMCAQLMIDTVWLSDYVETNKTGETADDFIMWTATYAHHNNDRLAAWRHAACQVAAMMGERV